MSTPPIPVDRLLIPETEPGVPTGLTVLEQAITVTVQNPGLGGGPLLDAHGRMIGVVALSLAEVGKFTLAVPASLAVPMLEQVDRTGRYVPPAPRAWLGITCYALRDHVVLAGIVPRSAENSTRPRQPPSRPRVSGSALS